MDPAWINLYCSECNEEWQREISKIPTDSYECKECDREAATKEFLRSEKDLEIYKSLKP
ncbi:MAG: hypothetical protein ABEK59_07875 [Halobacteria archaeon]